MTGSKTNTFDEKRDVITWNYVTQKPVEIGTWAFVQKRFTVLDDDIKYLKFGLVGVGKGDYRFDDLIFQKYAMPFDPKDS